MDHRFLWKGGIQPSDIYHWLSAVCGEKALVQLGIELQHRQLSASIIAAPLKNCSLKPSKTPKDMAVMYKYNPGEEYVELPVV